MKPRFRLALTLLATFLLILQAPAAAAADLTKQPAFFGDFLRGVNAARAADDPSATYTEAQKDWIARRLSHYEMPSSSKIDMVGFSLRTLGLRTIEGLVEDFADELTLLSDDQIRALTTPPWKNVREIDRLQAAEDIETAFLALKTSYGPYVFFGGDEVFDRARDDTLAALQTLKEPIQTKKIAGLLSEHLAFIQDRHFSIDGKQVTPHYDAYSNGAHVFRPTEDGRFATTVEKTTYYLDDILLADSLRPTILKSGEIAYQFFMLDNQEGATLKSRKAQVVTKGGRKTTLSLSFRRCTTIVPKSAPFDVETTGGVKVISLRTMDPRPSQAEDMTERLEASAADARGESVFILDLRGNSGGSSRYPVIWYESFVGHPPHISETYAYKPSPLGMRAFKKGTQGSDEYAAALSGYDPNSGTWSVSHDYSYRPANDSLIFVLIDENTGSAAEMMVEHLRTLENVLFVGTNTNGCLISPGVSSKYLPNSKLELYFGSAILFGPTERNLDGIGYEPDLWVNPKDALIRVLALCDFYGLDPKTFTPRP